MTQQSRKEKKRRSRKWRRRKRMTSHSSHPTVAFFFNSVSFSNGLPDEMMPDMDFGMEELDFKKAGDRICSKDNCVIF